MATYKELYDKLQEPIKKKRPTYGSLLGNDEVYKDEREYAGSYASYLRELPIKQIEPTKQPTYGVLMGNEVGYKDSKVDISKPYSSYLQTTASPDRRGRQFPLKNNSSGEVDLETGNYSDYADLFDGADNQRQQALNQIEVNRQLGKSTYGVTAEQLGQAGLTGSGYAQFLDNQNEMVAEEAKKGLEVAEEKAKEALTFTLTDGDGKSQTITTDSLEAIDKHISEGTITSAEELKTIRNAFKMSDEEYTARATAIYDKNYAPLAKEYDTVSAGSDNAAVESLFGKIDSEYAQGKISQSQYQDLYFKDNKQSIEDLVASQNVAEVKRGINIDKSKLGDTKYNELIKLLEEKEKSLLKNEQRQSSIIANSIDGGGTSRGAAGLDIAKKAREWFESKKK